MKTYLFKWLSHLGYMEDSETEDEANFPSGTAFYLASDVNELLADAERFRWLMTNHGETIRKALSTDRLGDVIHIPLPR
jgi:hypothetical protein